MSDKMSRYLSRGFASIALAAALYYAVFGGEYTISDIEDLRGTVEARAGELADLRAEHDSLRAWADSLVDDPWVIERVARERYGFLRPGEMVFRFVDAPPSEPDPEAG